MKSWASMGLVLALTACGTTTPSADAGPISGPPLDGNVLRGMSLSPLELTPAFSTSIHDYAIRCNQGDNLVTLTETFDTGTLAQTIDLAEDEELDVGDYHVRCLPHDFPHFSMIRHPSAGAPTPGYYLANSNTFAVVLDSNGVPVWYTRGTAVGNVDAPLHDTLVFLPYSTGPYGYVDDIAIEVRSLNPLTVTTFKASGAATDGHEHLLLANGNYVTITYPIAGGNDLRGLANYGANENVADCVLEEVDTSGNLYWSWRASDHLDVVGESLEPATNTVNGQSVVDPFHCNSIDVDASGNLLVSMRHTNAIYYIDRATGVVQWKLGGTPNNRDGAVHVQTTNDPETTFNMQHDARFQPNGDISLFDDHGADKGASGEVARGVEYAIDQPSHTASVVFQFLGLGESLYTGSFRRYADGDSVIGWGMVTNDPRMATELNAAGDDVLDITSDGGDSYRVIKVPLDRLDIEVLRATAAK